MDNAGGVELQQTSYAIVPFDFDPDPHPSGGEVSPLLNPFETTTQTKRR